MTNALSLYLDALRFSAAFTVFLSHYAVVRYSGGLFWQMMPYGRTAVLVFFVLSGFVIAWVTETRERTLQEYTLSRIARLCPIYRVYAQGRKGCSYLMAAHEVSSHKAPG